MKGIAKAITAGAVLLTLGACSSTMTYENQTSYTVPKWYNNCEQYDTDEYWKLFWAEENFVGCGTSIDASETHSNMNALMNAKVKIADRINGVVESTAGIVYHNDNKDSKFEQTNRVQPSTLTDYEIVDKFVYPYQGKFVTFIKIKVPTDQITVHNATLPN